MVIAHDEIAKATGLITVSCNMIADLIDCLAVGVGMLMDGVKRYGFLGTDKDFKENRAIISTGS